MMRTMIAAAGVAMMLAGYAAEPRGVRVSERWGYDPEDATKSLQAALDSGEPKIVIDRQAGPWYTLPLKGRSNQTIVVEKGAELKAKRGEFRRQGDCLIMFAGATNVVLCGGGRLSMWHDDYLDKAKYAPSEWRHAVSLYCASDVRIEDLTIAESGGDGVYLGVTDSLGRAPNRHVVIRNVRFDYNHRQGISVISAEDLLIEGCDIANTRGTAPEDGIDFEPNRPGESLVDCVVRDCTFSNNAGRAVEVVLYQFDASSKPVSIRVENCRSTGNVGGFSYVGARNDITVPVDDGRIDVVNCVFARENGYAVSVARKVFSSGALAFKDCLFDCCNVRNPKRPDCDILVTGHEIYPADTVSFENVTIRQGESREWLAAPRLKSFRGTPTRIEGAVKVVAPDGSERTEVLDDAWRAAHYPSIPGSPVETLAAAKFDPARFVAVDAKPGEMVRMSPLPTRWSNRYAFFAARPGRVRLSGHQRQVGSRPFAVGQATLMRFGSGKPLAKKPLPKTASLEFDIGEAGLYTLKVSGLEGNAFVMDAADVPLALDTTTATVALIYPTGDFHVWLPPRARFGAFGCGDGVENFAAAVFDPSGRQVYAQDNSLESFHYTSPSGAAPGLWRIRISKPAYGVLEDCVLSLKGVPGFLFLSPEKYWKEASDVPAAEDRLVRLSNANGTALVDLEGAYVLSYVPAGGKEVLFRASAGDYSHGQWRNEGIPISWPWFDKLSDPESLPMHGFVRFARWSVLEQRADAGESYLKLGLEATPETRRIWPHEFRLTYEITLRDALTLRLTTENTDTKPMTLTMGLHPYFAVSDLDNVRIDGLGKAHERLTYAKHEFLPIPDVRATVRDLGWNRSLEFSATGTAYAVVWNAGDKWRNFKDFRDGDVRRYFCLEPQIIPRENAVVLPPGGRRTFALALKGSSL